MKRLETAAAFALSMAFCAAFQYAGAQVTISDGQNKIEVKGKKTVIADGSSKTSSGKGNTINVTGNGNGTETYNANGKNVSVSGNSHKIKLTGNAATIYVSGNDNTVSAEGAVQISASGNGNKVTYSRLVNGKQPVVSLSGHGTSVVKVD